MGCEKMSLEQATAIAEREIPEDIQKAMKEVVMAGLLPEGNYVTSEHNQRARLTGINGNILSFQILGNGEVELLDREGEYKTLPLTEGFGPQDAYDITYTAVHLPGESSHPTAGILHEVKPYY